VPSAIHRSTTPGGAGVAPEDGRADRPAAGVEQPNAVALGRDADQVGRLAGGYLAQGRGRGGDDLVDVLLGVAGEGSLGTRRPAGYPENLALGRKGDRLDDGRPGIEPDQHLTPPRPALEGEAVPDRTAARAVRHSIPPGQELTTRRSAPVSANLLPRP
jgi:hypothetical protein